MVSILSQKISGRQIKDSIISPPPTDLSKIWSALDQEKFERQEEDKRLWTVLDAVPPPIPDVSNIWSALRMETSERQAEFNSIRRVPNKAWRGGVTRRVLADTLERKVEVKNLQSAKGQVVIFKILYIFRRYCDRIRNQ